MTIKEINERFIRCANPACLTMFRVMEMPKECPVCHQPFNKHAEAETITDIIYNLLTQKTEKGYMECDPGGWVKGEELPDPNELRRTIGEPA